MIADDPRPTICPHGHPLWWFYSHDDLYWALCDHCGHRTCNHVWLWRLAAPDLLTRITEFSPATLIRTIAHLRIKNCAYEDKPWSSDNWSYFEGAR